MNEAIPLLIIAVLLLLCSGVGNPFSFPGEDD